MDEWFIRFDDVVAVPVVSLDLMLFCCAVFALSILKMRSEIREGERIGSDDTVPLEGRVSLDSKRDLSGATGMFPLVDQWAGALRWRGFRASDYIERCAERDRPAVRSFGFAVRRLSISIYARSGTRAISGCRTRGFDTRNNT